MDRYPQLRVPFHRDGRAAENYYLIDLLVLFMTIHRLI